MATCPNYLALQTWGVRPKSRPRRFYAFRSLLSRSVLYVSIVLILNFLIFCVSVQQMQRFDWDLWIPFWGIAWWFGTLFCVLAPFRMENRYSNARILQANHHDYYLAGMGARQILAGLAAPQLAGAKTFAWTFLAMVWGLFLFASSVERFPGDIVLFFILSFAGALLTLVGGTRFNLALWALYPGKGQRSLLTAALVFSSPITILTLCPPLLVVLYPRGLEHLGGLFFAEFVTLLVRSAVIVAVWRKGLDRLDRRTEV